MTQDSIPKELSQHVKRMTVPVDDSKRKCVDGGYREDQDVGALAMPGGDLGLSMALMDDRFGLSPEQAFSLVKNFVNERGWDYCWHSDTHADPEDGDHHQHEDDLHVGCGHCNASINNADRYGTSSERLAELLSLVRAAQEEGEGMSFTNLDREHAEKGILVNTSTEKTVKPWDEEQDVQFFILDKARQDNLARELVQSLQAQGLDVAEADFFEVLESQTNATLGLLGSSKGKPLYTVDLDGAEPKIKMVGHAPTS